MATPIDVAYIVEQATDESLVTNVGPKFNTIN